MGKMTKRERLLTAFRRGRPDRVPKWIQPGPYLQRLVESNTGSGDPALQFDLDIPVFVRYGPSVRKSGYSARPEGAALSRTDEWGVVRWDAPAPMRHIERAEDVEDYPFPDVGAGYRYAQLHEVSVRLKSAGAPVVTGYVNGTYEQMCGLRGMATFLEDLVTGPEFLQPCLDRVSNLKAQIAARYAEAGVDVLWTGDDLGGERTMVMAPDLWRKHLKPCIRRIVEAARSRNPGILVAFHSDGYIEPVIEDLIEVGIDVLQAVQPECMDVARLKRRFGDRLAFWGTVSTQHPMSFGTPDQVREEVRERIRTVGEGGGLCVGPSHTLEPPTPWENVEAFVRAADEYGAYEA